MSVLLPAMYVAFRLTVPISSSSNGTFVTVTFLLNVTVMLNILPILYVPSGAATFKTVGTVAFSAMSLEFASDPSPPGIGNVRSTSWFPAPVSAPRVCNAPCPA